jgi:hypothetical protein
MEGCMLSCNTSAYGCCPDGRTPAHGHGSQGCCLLYPYGCCPDNYQPAEGPHLEGKQLFHLLIHITCPWSFKQNKNSLITYCVFINIIKVFSLFYFLPCYA